MNAHEKSVAALLHAVYLDTSEEEVEIAPSIKLCRSNGSPVERLYEKLCLETGIDDGEPFNYCSYLLIAPHPENPSLHAGQPESLIDRLCNVITIITSQVISACRAIFSDDNFESSKDTYIVFDIGVQTEFLMPKGILSITDVDAQEISKAWKTSLKCRANERSRERIDTALIYYYHAWRAHYMEQTCLNLAIVLELLFAPHSQTETSHQISFNVARFIGETRDERMRVYKLVKKFYSIRSSIVHGGMPNESGVINITVEMFDLCSSVLKSILLNEELAETFNNEKLRKDILTNFLFE